jgi:pantoate--beta-alanine ligase
MRWLSAAWRSELQILTTAETMRLACQNARTVFGTTEALGLVPTMGALHEGHRSLVRAARSRCRAVAVSIFVNPTQFAPGEDLDRYPRTFSQDCAMLESEGVDLLFAPGPSEMYPSGSAGTFVEVPGISARLDGVARPSHFRGVATVVTKLFNITLPDLAFFGQKDAAQVAVLRAMVRDLNLPVTLVACPTVREADGLALSSRNQYLSPSERTEALALFRALSDAEAAARNGEINAQKLRHVMEEMLNRSTGLQPEYVEVVDPDTLLPLQDIRSGALLAVAARVGRTRLIDNVLLPRASPPEHN